MKILMADNSFSELFKHNKGHQFLRPVKKKSKADEFKKHLKQSMSEENEDWEEFRVLLPEDSQFWDRNYDDLK